MAATSTTVSSTQQRWLERLPGGKLKITIESMIEICRDHSANVKRWRDGQMALRWCAAGMVEAEKQFRKVNGFLHLPALSTALDDYVERGVTPIEYNKEDAA